MSDPKVRTIALFGAIALFFGGFAWFLSMDLWGFSAQMGFRYFASNDAFQPSYSTVAGPHTLSFLFSDPKALEGKALFQSGSGTVTVSKVDKLSGGACRIWFQAAGTWDHNGGDLISACLPQHKPGEDKPSTALSSLHVEPAACYRVYYSTYAGELASQGNEFAVTVFCSQEPAADQQTVSLVFNDLQMVRFEKR